MNRSQRIILVIAAGVVGVVADHAFTAWSFEGGWFGYAQNMSITVPPGAEPWRQALVRLGLLIAWTLLSLRLLRDPE